MNLQQEVARRRTFAIISHPDAGKTTLTEKFLLYGGAVHLAGSVTARKQQRSTVSDWMDLEKQRGISVSSTVLQFDFNGFRVNLLDTPGHQDFSEDTYRVLMAVDAVIMVIDGAKGIETQTRKLFTICRSRRIPIFTFVNKWDRPGREPLDLLDELERELGLESWPVNWPIGQGDLFRGVFDRHDRRLHLYERVPGGRYRAPVAVADIDDEGLAERFEPGQFATFREELDILEMAAASYDEERIRHGELTPVFFGSAVNNFGVELLLNGFLRWAPPPLARSSEGREVSPENEAFSGFVFKIQANMDPKHRDRVAFLRICSGRFRRDMRVIHVRTGKEVRLSFSHTLFGQERVTADEGAAGDIIGLAGHDDFQIGDTLAEETGIRFAEIPRFSPECFAYLHNPNVSDFKRFRSGLEQLLHEKVVQAFSPVDSLRQVPLLGAVGPLQFDVVKYRLELEYRCESRLELMPWRISRWLPDGMTPEEGKALLLPGGTGLVADGDGRLLLLFRDDWEVRFFEEKNPDIKLSGPPGPARVEAAAGM